MHKFLDALALDGRVTNANYSLLSKRINGVSVEEANILLQQVADVKHDLFDIKQFRPSDAINIEKFHGFTCVFYGPGAPDVDKILTRLHLKVWA